jgi:hypothetical protein
MGLNLAAALVIILLTPVFFDLSLLEQSEFVKITELYVSITGIILLTSLRSPEDRDNIGEAVYHSKLPFAGVFALRIGITLVLLSMLVCSVEAAALFFNSNFDFFEVAAGSWITSVFCGMLGLTFSSLFGDVTSGYLIAFAYYGFEFFTGGKYTRNFYLFSLLKDSFSEKLRLLAAIAVLFAFNVYYVYKKT